MRRFALLCCVAAFVGCAKSENQPADTTPAVATPPAPPAPKAIALADVAGKWNVKGMNEAGDSTLVTYAFTATSDTTGWSIKFANVAKPVRVHVVSVAGDSIVIAAGPYPSVLRKGVQVRTMGAVRLQDGKLVGTLKANYSVKTADSVRMVRTEGTRAP
jgi:hypothetical protein